MSEYNEGDRVRIEKDGEAHEGVVSIDDGVKVICRGEYDLPWRVSRGWTLTVLEKAAPPVPTEPGHYVDRDGEHWELGGGGNRNLDPYFAPYTRLEPVPETVQKVIEHLVDTAMVEPDGPTARDLRARFGVTQ